MDWLPLASAALGGLIGSGSTLMADRVRWRRETAERTAERQRAEEERKQTNRHAMYAEYLTALSRIRNGLREMAHDESASAAERSARLQKVFLESGAYELRSQLQLVAPESVVQHTEGAYKSLRRLRMAIEEGASFQDAAYLERRDHYHGQLGSLKQALRRDLSIDT
ncbi:hypothetical protein ACIBK8_34060 [Streptomyces sp. NPDC050161]|uniref:hypothetical protein n=1 Tax=Streptomyces sp. NPDC050161 TaxID=3365604 RepID=UPI0037BB15E9